MILSTLHTSKADGGSNLVEGFARQEHDKGGSKRFFFRRKGSWGKGARGRARAAPCSPFSLSPEVPTLSISRLINTPSFC